MEWVTKLCWLILTAIHVTPALPLFRPSLVQSLYDLPAGGALGLLLAHRAALFALVVIFALWAVIDSDVRRAASVIAAVSMTSFLLLYYRGGMPPGALRTVGLVDLAGLVPLLWVSVAAWRPTA